MGIAAANIAIWIFFKNILAVFECIRKAELKLTLEKCKFGLRQAEFFVWNISPEQISPQTHEIQNLVNKRKFLKSKKLFNDSGVRELLPKLYP